MRIHHMEPSTGRQHEIVGQRTHAIRNAMQRLLLCDMVSAEDADRQMRSIQRCVSRWQRARRSPSWIANQLAAVVDELKRRAE